jgi:PAS domain S-box-containing protein
MSTPPSSNNPLDDSKPAEAGGSRHSKFAAFDSLADAVAVIRNDCTIEFVNSKMRSISGDVTGKKCTEVLGCGKVEGACPACPINGSWDFEQGPYVKRIRMTNGRTVDLVVTRSISKETKKDFFLCVSRDVTDRVEAEDRLGIMTASFDQMSEAVCVADLEGRLIYVNKAYVQLTGYDEKQVAGLSMTDAADSSGTMPTIMKAALSRGWHGEMTGLRKNGARYYAQVDALPVTGENNMLLGSVGILHDMTRQKTEKVEYEKYTSELESKMEARTVELARRVSQLTTINKIGRVVTSLLDLDELLTEMVKSIAQGFGYKHVAMIMMDKERGDLYFKAGYGWHMDAVPRSLRIKLKEGIIGHAAYFGETLVSADVESDPRYVRKDMAGTKSELSAPVMFRGEILGVLDIQSETNDAFTRNDVNVIEMIADILATAITNARVYTESKEREAALSVLDRISKQISYRLEPTVVLDEVARDAANLLKAEKSMVGLIEPGSESLRYVAPYRVDKSKVEGKTFSAKVGIEGRSLRYLKAEVVNDYLTDPDRDESWAELFSIRSMIVAPLVVEGRGIGVINVYNKLGGKPFTKSDALFLSSLADHAAIALENANLLSSLNQRVHSQLALLETALAMQRQIDSSSIYESVAEKLRDVVWYDGLTFYKIDHKTSTVHPVLARGPYVAEIMAETFSTDIGITGYVARTGKAELVNDTNLDTRADHIKGTPDVREALIAIPLMGKDRVKGVLTLYRDGETQFTDTEFEIAQLFASQASVAVENAELYGMRESLLRESRRKVEQMAKVLDLTTSVMYTDDVNILLQRITDAVVQSFGFRRASIRLLELESDAFVLRSRTGYPSWVEVGNKRPAQRVLTDLDDKFRVGSTTYLVKYEDQPYGVESFSFIAHPELVDKPRAAPDAWHERDKLMAVMKDRNGRLTGFLLVDEPNDLKIPSTDQIEVIEILAGIASIAVENFKVFEGQVTAANEIALLNDLMTHDINNFNQGIMGYIELLLQDKRLDDNQRKYAERALIQVRNNARLIDNIRKLAKVRTMSDSTFAPSDLQKAAADAIDFVTKTVVDRKVTVVSTLAPGTHYVLANEYLDEVFLNVISNAIKFDTSRRVRVDVNIDDEASPQGDSWLISVIDRGRGIPDDRKNVVFERFATGVTGVKGFGLGLSIVSAIVEKFGGRIWVEDRIKGDPSKGTVLKIMLPKCNPPVPSTGSPKGTKVVESPPS